MLFSTTLVFGDYFLLTEAHFVTKKVQQWQSPQDNILIQFAYEPEKPIIDTFTELKFNILNSFFIYE